MFRLKYTLIVKPSNSSVIPLIVPTKCPSSTLDDTVIALPKDALVVSAFCKGLVDVVEYAESTVAEAVALSVPSALIDKLLPTFTPPSLLADAVGIELIKPESLVSSLVLLGMIGLLVKSSYLPDVATVASSFGCTAVAPADAPERIVARSLIVACLPFRAVVTTLLRTAFADVVDNVVSIVGLPDRSLYAPLVATVRLIEYLRLTASGVPVAINLLSWDCWFI